MEFQPLTKEKNSDMKLNKEKAFLISFVLVMVGITVLSLLPPKSGVELGSHDKMSHFIAYSVFSFNYGLVVSTIKKHFYGLPFLIAYGMFMEFCQGFVPGREPSWLDILANSSGVAIGLSLHLIYVKFLNKNVNQSK